MLFDLRSRGRRTTVRVVYLLLALVLLSGLILVGVGTGNNNGGLLNAFTNNGSGGNSSQNQAVNQQTKSALKRTKEHPNSAAAWSNLVLARYTAANTAGNFNSTTGVYSAGGKTQLKLALTAWDTYVKLEKKPAIDIATLAARAAGNAGEYSAAASAWQYVVADETGASSAQGYLCLAFTSYAAGTTHARVGDLAAAKAIAAAPKLQKLTLKSSLKSAKSSKTTAQQFVLEDC
jgi:hypothetical protein